VPWRQFTFSPRPNNVFLQFWQMFVRKRIWRTLPGLQLTLFVLEGRGNFKGRFSGTYFYMEKSMCFFFTLVCHCKRHKPQYYNWTYCTNMYIILVWKNKLIFFSSGFYSLYFIFPLSIWDYKKCFISLLKANVYTLWV